MTCGLMYFEPVVAFVYSANIPLFLDQPPTIIIIVCTLSDNVQWLIYITTDKDTGIGSSKTLSSPGSTGSLQVSVNRVLQRFQTQQANLTQLITGNCCCAIEPSLKSL